MRCKTNALRLFCVENLDKGFAAFIGPAIHARRVKAKTIIPVLVNRDNAAITLHIGEGFVDDVICGLRDGFAQIFTARADIARHACANEKLACACGRHRAIAIIRIGACANDGGIADAAKFFSC